MKWTMSARSLSLWLGVVGLALLLLASFLPYDIVSCPLIYYPCPPYSHIHIDITWQVWESEFVIMFNPTIINDIPELIFLLFVPVSIPIILVINIIRFLHKRALVLEIFGCVTTSIGLCVYLLMDGFEFLILANLLPTLGPTVGQPKTSFSLGMGFWLPILGFLLFIISIYIKLKWRVDKRR